MIFDGLGARIATPYDIPGGTADLRERGVIVTLEGRNLVVDFDFATIGRPDVAPAAGDAAAVGRPARFARGVGPLEPVERAVRAALGGHLGLRPTGRGAGAEVVELRFAAAVPLGADNQWYGVQSSAPMADRVLYDVVARGAGGGWVVVAPHSVYARASWHDFGIAHITDMHVARRIDGFRGTLEALGRHEAAGKMYNWNDRFRGFVRYANQLHDDGLLDVVVATGDLYDYLHEDGDDPAGDGNAAFLVELIRGLAPGPHVPEVEALRVPIFTVPGNHDYRKHPYPLLFNLDLGLGGEHQITNFSGLHLRWDDALAIEVGRNGAGGDDVPDLATSTAARSLAIDVENRPYRRQLGELGSYVVALGDHRVAMLDSSWDVGVVDSIADGLRKLVGRLSEDERTFVGGSPNCEGVSDAELAMTAEALDTTPDRGLFIVGIHAPLLNMPDTECPYYLRETQRTGRDADVVAYLERHDPADRRDSPAVIDAAHRAAHPEWFDGDGVAGPFVKRGSTQDLLDHGVSRGHSDELLRLLAGLGSRRPADVVLAGHTHHHNEFRVVRTVDGIAYALDFYTEDPTDYYPTRFTTDWSYDGQRWRPQTDVAYVRVRPGAPVASTPRPMPYDAMHHHVVDVPPYPDPLRRTTDPAGWWARHRPLVVQTAALGLLENSQVSFAGFRLLSVRNDVITSIDHVSMERLHAHDFRIPFEQVVARPVDPYALAQRTVEHGAPPAAGAPRGAQLTPGASEIFYRDAQGDLHELSRRADGVTATADLSAYVDAPRAVGDPYPYLDSARGQQVVLYRGTDRHVHSLYWSTGATGHDNLSASCGAPPGDSDPVGYHDAALDVSHVYYRHGGSIRELWWEGIGAVGSGDLVEAAGAPGATGHPNAYMDTAAGDHIVIYRDEHAHVRTLYWSTGAVGTDDLSGVAGATDAAGDPFGYYIAPANSHQIVYRALDGHVWELSWANGSVVSGTDLTAWSGCVAAASDPVACWNPATGAKHVVFVGVDGHVYDLRWVPGQTVEVVDLTLAVLGPLAAPTRPTVFVVPGAAGFTHHVVYTGRDAQVYEIVW